MLKKFSLTILISVFIYKPINGETTECKNEKHDGDCMLGYVKTNITQPYYYPTGNEEILTISFYFSHIQIFTNETCNAFPNLTEIVVVADEVEIITSDAFDGCKGLESISFAANKLQELPHGVFKNNPDLNHISFNDNQFKEIVSEIFWDTQKLKHLSFTENYLTEFPAHRFPQLNELTTISLATNELIDIDENEIMSKFPKLSVLFMEDNPFDCDRLRIIVDALYKKHIKAKENPFLTLYNRRREYKLTKFGTLDCLSVKEREKWLVDKIDDDPKRVAAIKYISKTAKDVMEFKNENEQLKLNLTFIEYDSIANQMLLKEKYKESNKRAEEFLIYLYIALFGLGILIVIIVIAVGLLIKYKIFSNETQRVNHAQTSVL